MRSNTRTEISGIDKTSEQVTKFEQPPWSTWLTETVTTQKVVKMPYTQVLRLEGTLSITLQRANRKTKTELVDVVDLYPGEKVETDAGGKRSVRLTNEGMFEATTEMDEEVTVEEPGPDELMMLKHNDLLRNNREKIVEEVKDQRALSELLEVMSSQKVVSEEQVQTISQSQSVKEGVDKLVGVLEKAEPEKFLVFLDILQREGYSELVELLDPRGMYPDSVRHISNLSGVVDHYFVTKKVSEVKDSLESGRGVILHGMPGSGKTEMAYKVAGDYARVHPHSVVWVIDGSSEEKINEGMANLKQRLSGDTNVDNNMFQSLLSRWKHFVLLINDLSPTVAIPIEILSSSAKMVITTQDSLIEFGDVAKIPIDGFMEKEAVEFLSPKMPPGTTEEQMRDLANLFSCLPLGLAAARASIHRGKMTVEEYKQQLHGRREVLEEVMSREDNWLQMHYRKEHQEAARNIFAALQLVIDKLDDQCKSGEERKCMIMLQPCAFLDSNNIPVLMLKSALESPTIGADAYFTERMRMYSLGNTEGAGVKRRLSIHSVTQMALRLHMEQEQQRTCINKLLQILVKFFVKDLTYSETHKFSLELMPHVEAALKHADKLKLKLGAEYPLMKARLLMVYGHLLIQKGTPDLSRKYLEEAKESLLQFADILSAESVERNPDYHTTSKELYQSLADKSKSLEDGFFKETVIRRTITKQNLRAVRDKLGAEHSTTRKLENMVGNFEPLTKEMYNMLVKSDLAIPVEKLKRIFLPELYISILFTLSKAILDLTLHYSDRPSTDWRC
ncbi:PREDICTED: uncharacterized protein LOC109461966 [Branchiostoma belcheri]|uniref:Uncharacterized protein LOC109461966 n=1 Tax=Branchiostoma belcheri TaxID=7741 RepID=A0A6P4XBX8_BRABE|nr:PREDICTED: uncharacterized protein LOC109461966 [Branchiostoma belcheri]